MVQFGSRHAMTTTAAPATGAVAATTAVTSPAAEPGPPEAAKHRPPRRVRIPTAVGTFDAIAAGPRDGQPVLLLHGFPELAIEWTDYVAMLGARGYRAVAVDQRGYSPDARPEATESYTLDLLAGDVTDLADSLGWDDFHLVGHDWGAAVAWVAAARCASRVRSLTAVSVPHLGAFAKALRTDPAQQEASKYMGFLRRVGVAERKLLAADAAVLRRFYTPGVTAEAVDAYVDHLSRPGALTAALNWYRANDFTGYQDEVSVPTLFVWGTEDVAIAASGVDDTVTWVSGEYRLEKISGAGHFTPEERPETVAPLLVDHLRSH